MQILVVNAGSSSLKLALFSAEAGQLGSIASEQHPISDADPSTTLRAFCDAHATEHLAAVAHRIVHGGTRLTEPCLIDEQNEQIIAALRNLAPLHNPVALKWVRTCRREFGDELPQIATFDTAFYRNLPAVAQRYALPKRWTDAHPIRRFGFHGLAHQAMWQRWSELNPATEGRGRVISLQLGSGCSITAIRNGEPLDTSMGFSPLEGLVMATRAGDVDPGLLLYLQEQEDLTPQAMHRILNQHSGLAGISGTSGDMRTLLASPEPLAKLAIDIYCYRARKYIGAYLAVLGGVDAILFGGGVGKNAPLIREKILRDLQWAEIALDLNANERAFDNDSRISSTQSAAAVWVIHADEAAIMAQQAAALITAS